MSRRLGQVIQRGAYSWLVRIFLGTDDNGKRLYANKTIRGTRKDAQAYLNAWLRDKDQGLVVRPSKITLSEHMDEWLDTHVSTKVEPETLGNYRDIVRLYIKPTLGFRKICDLTPLEIQRTYASMRSHLSPRTVVLVHTLLKSSLDVAVAWGRLSSNPVGFVDPPKRESREMTALNPEECLRFIEAAKSDPLYPMFLVSLSTGMRPGEVLALKWKDVNLESGTLQVNRSVTRKGRYKDPKTKKGRRQIQLTPTVVEVLRQHRVEQSRMLREIGAGSVDTDLVFVQKNGRPWKDRNVARHHFKQILEKAGLPDIRLYDLRHTFATTLLLNGEHPKVVADIMGDSTVETVLDTYSHVLPIMHKRAADKIEAQFFRDKSV